MLDWSKKFLISALFIFSTGCSGAGESDSLQESKNLGTLNPSGSSAEESELGSAEGTSSKGGDSPADNLPVADGAPPSGGASSGGNNSGTGGASEETNRHVIPDGLLRVDGRTLRVNDTPIHVRGVCWNPVTKGGTHPSDLDFSGLGATDIPLMRAAGINTVRTYSAITDTDVLDQLHAAGIKVIMSVYAWGGDEPSSALSAVNAVKNHPAILMWLLGNEWNYNGLYVGLSFDDSLARIQKAAQLIKEADPHHLVATSYGELPTKETIAQLSAIDVWGINTYRGISFGDLFSAWASRSSLPLIITEYGADAYDARSGGSVNLAAQADATAALAGAIENDAARNGGIVSGGTIFEWSDEWWKDGSGSPSNHDIGGIAPGGGPHPDATFNEEWWGVVTIEREPRPAYYELQKLFLRP